MLKIVVTIIRLIKIRITIISIIPIILILNSKKEDHHKISALKITLSNRVFPNIKNHSKRQHLKFKDH